MKYFSFFLVLMISGCSIPPSNVQSVPSFDEVLKKQKKHLPNGYALQSFKNILFSNKYSYDVYKGKCVDSLIPIDHYSFMKNDNYIKNISKGSVGFCIETSDDGVTELFVADQSLTDKERIETIKEIIETIDSANNILNSSISLK